MIENTVLERSEVYLARVGGLLDKGESVTYSDEEINVFAQGYTDGVYIVYRGIDNKEISSMFPCTENASIAFHALVHTKRDIAVVSLPWDGLVRKSFAASYSKLWDMLGSGHTKELYSFTNNDVRLEYDAKRDAGFVCYQLRGEEVFLSGGLSASLGMFMMLCGADLYHENI